jgi:RNA polymerase sigma-70 factor (ECF subfamily)
MKLTDLDNFQPISRGKEKKEKEVFIKAYDQYVDQIYRFVYFKVGNPEEAQDLTSTIFLKTWDYIQNNKINHKTLRALIYKIARNSVIDFYRGKSSYQDIGNLENAVNIIDEKQDIARRAELTSDLLLLEKSLLKLKDEYREVIILRFTEELSIREIAGILDKSRGSTRVLIYRALKALREIINSHNL